MNGLAEIVAINKHAQLKHDDEQRRKAGLKPSTLTGHSLRKAASHRPKFRAAPSRPSSGRGC